MADTVTAIINRPAWVDLATSDPGAARDFYGKVFGWKTEVNPDPQYGGYGLARIDGNDAAGIGGTQSPDQPTTWNVYIGTRDVEGLAEQVKAAGGTVAAPPFDVGDQGRMAVFQDPAGAFISAWQGSRMGGFQTQGPNAFGWAELNARGVERAIPFYERIFGWTTKPSGPGEPQYTEFQVDGESIAGALEMDPSSASQVPSHWMVYFTVDDVDASHKAAIDAGGRSIVQPSDYPGIRMAIVSDPQGATFGIMKSTYQGTT